MSINKNKYENEEIWKDIPGYEGRYQISNYGKVKELSFIIENGTNKCVIPEHILKPHISNNYLVVSLNKPSKTFYIHRLVAELFIDNPENKKCVKHITFNRYNNCYNNLKWCSHSEVVKQSIFEGNLKIPVNHGKSIVCIETGKKYPSIKEAILDTNLSYDSINNSVYFGKSVKGYTFQFI